MALELKPRIDFGGSPFQPPVSEFSLQWLSQQFVPAQRARRDTVMSACAVANKQIDDARRKAAEGLPVIGDKRADGSVLQSPLHLEQQRIVKSVSDQQVADVIRNIKLEVDAKVIPLLKDMHKASLVVVDLQARIFDKLSCLARVNADMNDRDEMAYRAHCVVLVTGAEPIVLHRLAQSAIDRGAPQDLILIHAVLCENIKLPRDRRAFSNAALLNLLEPPEFIAAAPLLAKVVDLEKEAGAAYANIAGHVGQVSLARISRGLAAVRLAKDGLPAMGDDDAV
jgi:hypothetical protein